MLRAAVSLVVVVVALIVPTPGHADTQILTIRNLAQVPPGRLAKVEAAIAKQVGVASRWWHLPTIRFGPGGWTITLLRGSAPRACDGEGVGCHFVRMQGGAPFAFVSTAGVRGNGVRWSDALDHEIIEMLADPGTDRFDAAGDLVEICDPTAGWDYMENGVWLSDFVLPTVYTAHPHGRADYMGEMTIRQVEDYLAATRNGA